MYFWNWDYPRNDVLNESILISLCLLKSNTGLGDVISHIRLIISMWTVQKMQYAHSNLLLFCPIVLNFRSAAVVLCAKLQNDWATEKYVMDEWDFEISFYRISEVILSSLPSFIFKVYFNHYTDVIMSTMTSQITSPRLFTQSFIRAQIKENIKAPRHLDRWIPHTKGQ